MISRFVATWITFAIVWAGQRRAALGPPQGEGPVAVVAIGSRYAGLAGAPLVVAAETPADERAGPLRQLFRSLALWTKEVWPVGRSSPEALAEGEAVYPGPYRWLVAAPGPHEGIDAMARVGPFSLLSRAVDGGLEIDARLVENLVPQAPFVKTGGLGRWRWVGDETELEWVEADGLRVNRGDPGFGVASRRLLVGLGTQVTLVEHLVKIHLVSSNLSAIATREALPTEHPLRILLQPFIIEGIRLVNDHVDGLIKSRNSNVPQYSGLPLEVVHEQIAAAVARFRLEDLDPRRRAEAAGTAEDPRLPTVADSLALFKAFRRLAQGYVNELVPEGDLAARAWVRRLDELVPNGVRGYLGVAELDAAGPADLAELVALVAYTASVGHYVVSAMVRSAQLDFGFMPPAVDAEGRTSRGAAFEKLGSVMVASIRRYDLVRDELPGASAAGHVWWERFQEEISRRPVGAGGIDVRQVSSSSHA